MAFNDGIHRIKDVLKKQIGVAFRIYLSIAIILSPLYLITNANAAGLGGWSLGGGVSQGASTIYNGSKEVLINGAKKIAMGTAKVTPAAADVAKLLGKGVGGVALSVAVEQLLGAVDWVLDPANNQIVYTKPDDPTNIDDPTLQYYYECVDNATRTGSFASSAFSACSAYLSNYVPSIFESATVTNCTKKNNSLDYQCSATLKYKGSSSSTSIDSLSGRSIANPAYDPAAEKPENKPKHLPLPTVAQKIISNAESGNADAQTVTKAAADTIVADAETDSTKSRPIINQLEATQSIPTSQTATGETVPKDQTGENTGTDTKGSDISLEFPVFCNWAPSVCQAANVVITKPQEWAENIKAAYDDAVDYFKEEPSDLEPEELEIEQPEFEADDVNLQGSTTCPQDQVSFSLMGNSYTLDMPYQPVCNALEFFRPAVLTVGAITSAFIVAGIRTKEDEE